MGSITLKTANKVGFFTALTMLLGCVVGIGIFFKNNSVLKATEWSGISTLLSWVVGGLISLAAAVSFSEIAWMKNSKKVSGLASWSEKVGGLKYGYFSRFSYAFFYYGMLSPVLCVFGSETLINILTVTGAIKTIPDVWIHIVIGAAIFILFAVTAQISMKTSGIIQQVTTVLKFLPLIITIILGIVLPTANFLTASQGEYSEGLKDAASGRFYGENAFTNGQPFVMKGLLAALPAVLFAYDAFLNVSNLHSRMKNPKKLSVIVLFGMISIIILYSLLVVSQTIHGVGMVSGRPFGEGAAHLGLFGQIFTSGVGKQFGIFITCFIAISIFGVINGYSLGGVVLFNDLLKSNTLFGSKFFIRKFKTKKKKIDYSGFAYFAMISFAFLIMMSIPAIITNNDAYIDGLSNFPTLFFFALYATTILMYTLKRSHFTKEYKKYKLNNYFYNIFAWIAIIGIYTVIAYSLLYNFTFKVWLDPTEAARTSSWGLFQSGGVRVTLMHESITFLGSLAIFFIAPFINYLLVKKYYGINLLKESSFENTDFLNFKIKWKFANLINNKNKK